MGRGDGKPSRVTLDEIFSQPIARSSWEDTPWHTDYTDEDLVAGILDKSILTDKKNRDFWLSFFDGGTQGGQYLYDEIVNATALSVRDIIPLASSEEFVALSNFPVTGRQGVVASGEAVKANLALAMFDENPKNPRYQFISFITRRNQNGLTRLVSIDTHVSLDDAVLHLRSSSKAFPTGIPQSRIRIDRDQAFENLELSADAK